MNIEPLPPPAPSREAEVHRRLRDLIVSGEPAAHRATGLMRRADHRRLEQALRAMGEVVDGAGNVREYLRRDAGFHRVILRASGNRRLTCKIAALG